MQRAECATESLKSRNDLGVLSISASFKIAERDDFDQVEQRDGFVSPRFIQFAVKLSPNRQELLTESFLLIVTSRIEIGAITGTGNPYDAMFSTAGAADQSPEGRARALTLSAVTIGTGAHLLVSSGPGLGGGGMNP